MYLYMTQRFQQNVATYSGCSSTQIKGFSHALMSETNLKETENYSEILVEI